MCLHAAYQGIVSIPEAARRSVRADCARVAPAQREACAARTQRCMRLHGDPSESFCAVGRALMHLLRAICNPPWLTMRGGTSVCSPPRKAARDHAGLPAARGWRGQGQGQWSSDAGAPGSGAGLVAKARCVAGMPKRAAWH